MKFDKKLKCAKVCENRILLASADELRRLLAKFLVQSHSAHRKNSSTQMEFKIKGVMTPFLFAPPQILYSRVVTKLKTIGLYCYIFIYPTLSHFFPKILPH